MCNIVVINKGEKEIEMTLLELESLGFRNGWRGHNMILHLGLDDLDNELILIYEPKEKMSYLEKIDFESFFLESEQLHRYKIKIKTKEELLLFTQMTTQKHTQQHKHNQQGQDND